MVARWLGHAPARCSGMRALKIVKNDARIFHVFGSPLRFRENDPIERALRAFFESMRQEGLRMPHESDLTGADAKLFPNQTHQPITIRAAGGVPVPAGGQNQSDLLGRPDLAWDGTRHLIGESLDHQRMRRIDVIVMDDDLRMRTPGFADRTAQRFALQQVEIQRRWEHENFA